MPHYRIYLTLALLLLVGLACAMPGLPMDENEFNTAVAQTVAVGLTRNYMSPTATLTSTLTFTPTLTSELPTVTDTPIETITPTFPFTPTGTETSIVPPPELVVSVNTNCRTGPGKAYVGVGTLLVGETVNVYGIDPSGRYWYINNPDPGEAYCWLSSKYATVEGAVSFVPVLTPRPTATPSATMTPVPDFALYYIKMETCGSWWLDFDIKNSGRITFKSVRIKMKDTRTGFVLSQNSNDFKNFDGCDTIGTTVDVLEPDQTATVSSPYFTYNPAGRKLIITVTVCTEEKNVGICLSKELTFKP